MKYSFPTLLSCYRLGNSVNNASHEVMRLNKETNENKNITRSSSLWIYFGDLINDLKFMNFVHVSYKPHKMSTVLEVFFFSERLYSRRKALWSPTIVY